MSYTIDRNILILLLKFFNSITIMMTNTDILNKCVCLVEILNVYIYTYVDKSTDV